MTILWLSGACVPDPASAGPRPHALVVAGLDAPGAEVRTVQVAPRASVDGAPFPLRWQPLVRTGDVLGGVRFGELVSRSGRPIDGCEGLDYSGLWAPGGTWELLTHYECLPSAIYRSPVEVDAAGNARLTGTRRVDTTAVDGGNYFCAGAPTSWGTHLAAEEYEGDIRKRLPDGHLSDDFEGYHELARWWEDRFAESSPWDYGWVLELPPAGAPARRLALGRFSHELALPMPDDRTVYLTDDTPAGGTLYRFVADRPGDLTAGTLHAAQWRRRPDGSHALTWLDLGHATEAEVAAARTAGVGFAELFTAASPDPAGGCPAGTALSVTSWGPECLAVQPAWAAAASRLETRRVAALAGATTELVKAEGMALAADRRRLYVSLSRYAGPALAGPAAPGARDDLHLAPNACGGVWELELGRAGAPWEATVARPLLEGVPTETGCAADGIANPDNLAWIEGTDTLAIAEDTERHPHAALWFYDVRRKTLARALTVPPGGEVSGLRWAPDMAGAGWLSVSVQHPFDGVDGATEDERHSIAGLLGPFPAWTR